VTEWIRAWHRYRRQNRFLLMAFGLLLVLSLGAVYLLQRTQAASPRELTNHLLLFVLWYLDISLILVLSFILLRNVFRLAVERRAGVLGGRFRTKLVLTYVALTFVPVIFIFLIATNLLQRSIDRWFSSPVEEVLRGGAAVTIQLRELVEDRLERQADRAREELQQGRASSACGTCWGSTSSRSTRGRGWCRRSPTRVASHSRCRP
jgi:two-component system, NtrC family, nitrogen regulation sensor histidine kinase NtrY